MSSDQYNGEAQPAVETGESPAAKLSPLCTTSDPVVAGEIPQQLPGFQPRPDRLEQLDRAGPGIQVLTGLRGVGKTQLAAAYARARVAGGWRMVAWINAEDIGNLLAGLATVAEAVGLSDSGFGRDMTGAGQAVRQWLEAGGDRCLIVFDNAADPDVLRPFLPAGGAALVLITSTQQSVADLGTSVPVDAFTVEEALAFLEGRTGLVDEAGATAVAAELDFLPLALAQAAAVIASRRLDYETYLKQLRMLPVEKYLIPEEEQSVPRRVTATIQLSLEAVRAADQTGVCTGVMEVLAVLSEAGVRRELLYTAGQSGVLAHDGRQMAAATVDRALKQLAERYLLTLTMGSQTVIMHRLVAHVVRDGLARQERLAAVCRAAASVLEAHATALAGSGDRPAVRDIPRQVAAMLENAAQLGELTRALLRLRFWSLYYLTELGDSAPQAIAIGEPLIADLERRLGLDHPDTLNARNSLAAAYRTAGRIAEAVPLFERTLIARQRLLGPDHPDTLTSQNNLAATYQDAGRIAEAILLLKLTLAVRERLFGANNPSALTSLGNLAAAYRAAGRVAEAIPLLEQTVAGRERVLGSDHPDTVASRNNLAAAHQDAGRASGPVPSTEPRLYAQESLSPADPAGELVPEGTVDPNATLTDDSHSSSAQDPLLDPEDHPDSAPVQKSHVAPVEETPADPVVEAPAAPIQEASAAPAEELPAAPVQGPPIDPVPETPTVAESQEPDRDAWREPALKSAVAQDLEPEVRTLERSAGTGPKSGNRRRRQRMRVQPIAMALLILLVAAGVTLALLGGHVGRKPVRRAAAPESGQTGGAAAATVQMAGQWVSQQVSRSVIVACDPVMCSTLKARRVPAANLLILRTDTTSPLGAQVVVVTPTVRSQFGRRLDSVYAPSVIASFGSGPGQVSVQVIAKDGPTSIPDGAAPGHGGPEGCRGPTAGQQAGSRPRLRRGRSSRRARSIPGC